MVAATIHMADIKRRRAAPARSMTKKQWFWSAALVGFLLVASLIPRAAASTPSSITPNDESPATVATSTPTQSPDELDQWLSRLAFEFECVGACRHVAEYKRLDTNSRYSYGCLQFQEATWLSFARKHGVDPWANGGIYECDNQRKVARLMFEEDVEAAAQHWYTSIYKRGLGLPNI